MEKGKLYIVATPIGNLEDITYRAIDTLKSVDIIGVEDTRHSAPLLSKYNISTPTVSYFEYNEIKRSEEFIRLMEQGKNIAIISDAGTPAINDPGYRLISEAVTREIQVVPIPGPSSVLTALVGSGFPTDRFTFEGFLPKKKGRQKRLEELKTEERTIIIFEGPHRVEKTLEDCLQVLGDRDVAIGREMTKLYEEFHRGKISEVLEYFRHEKPRGEFVFVIKAEKIKKEKVNKYAKE
ncbi:MAG: 16S rRNA (cytidine(1402)-2'-O)-methyltransferase [Candidatus Marinimicrobia bacterium]|nr:16S rRNA (cytidine(1402)-2'-O)-methyltransferase [Candidatus Neomarinimicrobiota bacterium]